MVQHTAFACLTYTLLSQTAMIIMFIVNYTSLSTRFDYEKIGYHGHADYPASKKVQSNSEEGDQALKIITLT